MPDLSKRAVYTVPAMSDVVVRRGLTYRQVGSTKLSLDAYAPPSTSPTSRAPVLMFIHGGPIPSDMPPATEWGIFQSYGELAAASGFVGITFQHRLHGPLEYVTAQYDVAEAIAYVRAHAAELGADADRIVLWAFSGGGPLLSQTLRERPPFVRALVAFYAALDLRHLVPDADPEMAERARLLSPAALVDKAAGLPIFVARAGRDNELLNQSIDTFVREALAARVDVDLVHHAQGEHGFDALNDDDRSRQIIARALDFARAATR